MLIKHAANVWTKIRMTKKKSIKNILYIFDYVLFKGTFERSAMTWIEGNNA